MSWDKAEGRLLAAKIDTVRLSVREVKRDRRTKGTRNSLIFYIGNKIGREMGLSACTRINLFWGSGKNDGWCRIEVAAEGRFSIRQTHRGGVRELASFYFKTQQHPLNGGVPHPAAVCKHIVTPDRALEIKLPGWFWRPYEYKKPYMPKVASISTPRGSSTSSSAASTTTSATNSEKPKQNGAFSHADGG